MLKITEANFITSAPTLKECPTWALPEIAMVGRSNVGKSSFINRLTNRKNLAKTSNTPGKTRLMNFYEINKTFAFVDLPGYGYAKVSHTIQAGWQKHLEAYLSKRENMLLIVQLIDARHGPQPNDHQMAAWLASQRLPVALVMTKIDKVSKNDLGKQLALTAKEMRLEPSQVFPFSAEAGTGKDAILRFISDCLRSGDVRPV